MQICFRVHAGNFSLMPCVHECGLYSPIKFGEHKPYDKVYIFVIYKPIANMV